MTTIGWAGLDLSHSGRLRIVAGSAGALLVVATLWVRAPWADALLKRNAEGFATLTAVAVLYAAAFVLRAAAWRLLMVTSVELNALVRNLHLSLVLNHLLPVKAGEVSRPLLAARRGVPLSEAVASTLAARVMDLLCLALLAVVLMPVHRAVSASALGGLALGAAVLVGARTRTGTRLLGMTIQRLPGRVSTRVEATSSALAAIRVGRLALAMPIVLVSWRSRHPSCSAQPRFWTSSWAYVSPSLRPRSPSCSR